MTISHRKIYSPIPPMPHQLYVVASKPLQAAWDAVLDGQTRWQVAKEQLAATEANVAKAIEADKTAASQAVEAGKPIPASKETAAREAVHQKKREVQALETRCHTLERTYQEMLADESVALSGTFIDKAQVLLTAVNDALAAAQQAMNEYGSVVGTWRGLYYGGGGTNVRIIVKIGDIEQTAQDVLDFVRKDASKQLPSEILRREQELAAAFAAERDVRMGITTGLAT